MAWLCSCGELSSRCACLMLFADLLLPVCWCGWLIQGEGLQQQLTAASATEADLRKQLEAAVAEAATLQVSTRLCMHQTRCAAALASSTQRSTPPAGAFLTTSTCSLMCSPQLRLL